MTDRVLVTGAAGRLGAAIVERYAGRDVVAHTRATLDITDPEAVRRAVRAASPHLIVNCAAFNDVDGAESRAVDALAVNAFAVRSLARAAEACGAALVHFSTDFVFDGTATVPYREEDAPAPRSTYAATKLLGEWFALDCPRGYVLRVESLFGAASGWRGRQGSVDAILDGLVQGAPVRVFTDRVVSPSFVQDVAHATEHLVSTGAPAGLYHCVNSGATTWFELASQAARFLGVAPRLDPITLDAASLRAPRPKYCALATTKLAEAGFAMPPWQDALERWVNSRLASRGTMDGLHG
jgi:dTDP-4-dehydrorhamnose reductase